MIKAANTPVTIFIGMQQKNHCQICMVKVVTDFIQCKRTGWGNGKCDYLLKKRFKSCSLCILYLDDFVSLNITKNHYLVKCHFQSMDGYFRLEIKSLYSLPLNHIFCIQLYQNILCSFSYFFKHLYKTNYTMWKKITFYNIS